MTTIKDKLRDLIFEYKNEIDLFDIGESIYENEEDLIDGTIDKFFEEESR